MKPYLAPRRGAAPVPPGWPSAIEMGKAYMPREQMFAVDRFWNKRIPADAATHPNSATWVAGLCKQLNVDPATGDPIPNAFPGTAQVDGAIPVYVVPDGYPRTPVSLFNEAGAVGGAYLNYWIKQGAPLPQDWVAGLSDDHYMNVVQPSANKAWEFFGLTRTDSGVKTSWGGYMHNMRTFPGMGLTGERDLAGHPTNFDDWFPSAASISLLGGILQREEVEAGVCNHPLQMSVAFANPTPLWPGRRADGWGDATSPPEGGLYQLDPTVDVDWVWSRWRAGVTGLTAQEIARARDFLRLLTVTLQTWGMYIVDQTGGGCAMQLRDYRGASGYQKGWPEWFGKAWYPYTLMSSFMWAIPWNRTRVLVPIA